MRKESVEFSQEVFDEICERIADGESLRSICRDEHMPRKASVFRWLADPELSDQYARARQVQADSLFDDVLQISDDSTGDYVDGEFQKENIQRARLRVDARKWMAGKLRPKVYGDKLELSGDQSAPFTVQIVNYGDSKDT